MSDLKQRLAALEEAINNTSPYREPGRRAGLLAEADQVRHVIKLQDEPKDTAFHLYFIPSAVSVMAVIPAVAVGLGTTTRAYRARERCDEH